MTDIEKEMEQALSGRSSKEDASACYEIHRKEMIKMLEEIIGGKYSNYVNNTQIAHRVKIELKKLKKEDISKSNC